MVTRLLCATRVLLTRLQLALGLRRSQHVRVMRGTTVLLIREEGHAVRARLAGTRVKRLRMALRVLCAMHVLQIHLLQALGLRRSLIVRAV